MGHTAAVGLVHHSLIIPQLPPTHAQDKVEVRPTRCQSMHVHGEGNASPWDILQRGVAVAHGDEVRGALIRCRSPPHCANSTLL